MQKNTSHIAHRAHTHRSKKRKYMPQIRFHLIYYEYNNSFIDLSHFIFYDCRVLHSWVACRLDHSNAWNVIRNANVRSILTCMCNSSIWLFFFSSFWCMGKHEKLFISFISVFQTRIFIDFKTVLKWLKNSKRLIRSVLLTWSLLVCLIFISIQFAFEKKDLEHWQTNRNRQIW